MAKLRIGNKYGVRHIDIHIAEPEDAKTMLNILAKNDIPAVLCGETKENSDGHKDNN